MPTSTEILHQAQSLRMASTTGVLNPKTVGAPSVRVSESGGSTFYNYVQKGVDDMKDGQSANREFSTAQRSKEPDDAESLALTKDGR